MSPVLLCVYLTVGYEGPAPQWPIFFWGGVAGMFLKTLMEGHDIWQLNPSLAYLTLVYLSLRAELLKLSQGLKCPQSLFHCYRSDLLYQLEE